MTFIFFIVLKKTHEHKTVVLRKKLEESEALEIIDDKKLYFVLNNNEKKYIPNFLVEKNNEVDDFNQIFNGLKLTSDYLDKSILRPNNISHPKSRIEFLNVIKE